MYITFKATDKKPKKIKIKLEYDQLYVTVGKDLTIFSRITKVEFDDLAKGSDWDRVETDTVGIYRVACKIKGSQKKYYFYNKNFPNKKGIHLELEEWKYENKTEELDHEECL